METKGEEDVSEEKPAEGIEEEPDRLPDEALEEIIAETGSSKLRLAISLFLLIPLCYIMFAGQIGLPIPKTLTYVHSPFIYLFICIALQTGVMMLCLETIATGIRDLFHLHPNMESVVALSSIVSILHAGSIIVFPAWGCVWPISWSRAS